MTYTPIPAGSADWDVPVNAAFTSQDGRITTAEGNISSNSANISTHTGQITALQGNVNNADTAQSYGLLGWTTDPAAVGTGSPTVTGTLHLARVNVNTTGTATKIFWGINTPGSGTVAGQNFVSLWDSAGTRLANVGVDARITSTGLFQETISAAVTPGLYWVGFLTNSTTPPQVYRTGNLNGTLANTGLGAAQLRFATNGTGLTASPASITPGSNAVSQVMWYAALAT